MTEKNNAIEARELLKMLEEAIDEEPDFVHFIPVSNAVAMLWSDPELRASVVALIAKKILQKQLNGNDQKAINAFFVDHLKLEQDFINLCGSSVFLASPIAADISDDILEYEDGLAKLAKKLGKNHELAKPLLDAVLVLVDEMGTKYTPFKFDLTKIANPDDKTELQLELHRQLAAQVFGVENNSLLEMTLAIAQDYLDGTPLKQIMHDVESDLGEEGREIAEQVFDMVDTPTGPWIIAVDEMKRYSIPKSS